MVSFAFNTMIGQVTPVALAAVGRRYYLLFILCDITNALFFYLYLPETKGLSLEAMDDLFTNSSWFTPTSTWVPPLEVNPDALAEKKEEMMMNEGSDGRKDIAAEHIDSQVASAV